MSILTNGLATLSNLRNKCPSAPTFLDGYTVQVPRYRVMLLLSAIKIISISRELKMTFNLKIIFHSQMFKFNTLYFLILNPSNSSIFNCSPWRSVTILRLYLSVACSLTYMSRLSIFLCHPYQTFTRVLPTSICLPPFCFPLSLFDQT